MPVCLSVCLSAYLVTLPTVAGFASTFSFGACPGFRHDLYLTVLLGRRGAFRHSLSRRPVCLSVNPITSRSMQYPGDLSLFAILFACALVSRSLVTSVLEPRLLWS